MVPTRDSKALAARKLDQHEVGLLTDYNVGVIRNCACSARYTHASLSPESDHAALLTAIDILIDRMPALSSFYAIDTATQTHVLARTPRRPVFGKQVQLRDDVDLDPTSESYRAWKGWAVDTPIDVHDPERPAWRVFMLFPSAAGAAAAYQGFDARVVFVYSHMLMDGLCGPFFHEVLSEVLSNPNHAYRMDRLADYSLDQRLLPSLDGMWDFEALVRAQPWTIGRFLRPLSDFIHALLHTLLQPWMPVYLFGLPPTVIKTVALDSDILQSLLEQSRARGVTLTNVINACAVWAFASALLAAASSSAKAATTVPVETAVTRRPGHPFARYLTPGPGFTSATRLDAILPPDSAFRRIFLVAAWIRQSHVTVSRSSNFWAVCRDNRALLTDDAMNRRSLAQWGAPPRARDSARYQRRFLAATDDAWTQARGPSPRVLTGHEGSALLDLLADGPPAHLLTNNGASVLAQGDGWSVGGLSRVVGNTQSRGIATVSCACATGLVLNVVPRPGLCGEAEAEVFVRCLERGLRAVAAGRVGERGTMEDLVSMDV